MKTAEHASQALIRPDKDRALLSCKVGQLALQLVKGERPRCAKLAFQVISERYDHRRSTCITTNRVFKDWTKVFPDPLNAQVIAERLTERAEVFLMDGKKYRDPRNHETV